MEKAFNAINKINRFMVVDRFLDWVNMFSSSWIYSVKFSDTTCVISRIKNKPL